MEAPLPDESLELADSQVVSGNTSHTRPENRAFYPALDGLRAIAFLMVFFYHYDGLPWGWAGVDIFFVLSGFLITGILWDTRNDPHRAGTFYIRRTLRIFPLYYGVMLAILLLQPIVHWRWSWYWLVWPLYMGNLVPYLMPHFVPGAPFEVVRQFFVNARRPNGFSPLILGHFWTLCVEEQFYLVWPWMVFSLRDRRKLAWICAASLPFCMFLRMLGIHHLSTGLQSADIIFHATPFRVDDLLLGALVALLLRGPNTAALLRWSRFAAPAAFLVVALWSLRYPYHRFWTRPYIYPSFDHTMIWGLTIVAVLAALLILVVIQPCSLPARLLSWTPLRRLGRISYGAYVFHMILVNGYPTIGTRLFPHHIELGTSIVGLTLTILLAWLSFRFYETPFLNLKERWTIRRA
jgi:peptidoglycan/LPS O-acetylase OafA/YrhL